MHMQTIILSTYRYISALIKIDTYELSIVLCSFCTGLMISVIDCPSGHF